MINIQDLSFYIFMNRNIRNGTNPNLIALVLNFTLILVVGDVIKNRSRIEFLIKLTAPNFPLNLCLA